MNTIDAITAPTSQQQVAALYAGLLGRAADPGGLAFWSQQLDKGLSIDGLVDGMLASAEAVQLFGNASSAAFVTALYQSAFGRAPEAAGLQYWATILASAGTDTHNARSDLVQQMLTPLLSGAPANADQQAFANRTDASLYFAQNANFTVTLDNARGVVSIVTADPASLSISMAATDHGGVVPPAAPAPAPAPSPAPAPAPSTSPIDFTPNTGTSSGSSDASAALALGGNTMLIGDDEANVLRVYSRDGGAAVKEISYDSYLGNLGETDLEASARIGNTLYFTGSHSNNKSGVDQNSREVIFSATLSGTGGATTALAFTGKYFGMEAALAAWDHSGASGKAADYFGITANAASGIPERDAGVSIEGLSFSPDNSAMWLGFRAPATGGTALHKALIVPVLNYDAMLTASAAPVLGTAIELDLGGRGIRSIDKNAAGQYIIIAGPTGGSSADVPDDFRLYTWDGSVDGSGQATHLVQHAAALDALLATTGGSFESLVEVPDNLTDSSWIQLIQDDGDAVWAGQTQSSKDLPAAQQHFNGNWVQLGAAVAADTTAPLMTRSSPATNTSGVSITGTKVALTFNEAVHAGTGNFVLKADGSAVQTFSATDSHISYEYNTVTVDTSALLAGSHSYTLEVASGAVVDAAGNAFAGLDTAHAIAFNTVPAGTALTTGDIAFVGFNAKSNAGVQDAVSFVLLKNVVAGTSIHYTDKEWDGSAFNSGESDLVWTATSSLAAGTVVTLQPGAATPVASTGTLTGSGGGLGDGGEQVFAFTGTVASPGTFLAAIGMGTPSGGLVTTGADLNNTSFVPAGLALGSTAVNLTLVNAKYTGITSGTADELRAAISDASHWTTTAAAGSTITSNQLDLGYTFSVTPPAPTTLAAGDVVFLGVNSTGGTGTSTADAFAFMVTRAITAGTQIGFSDRDYSLTTGWPSNESAYIWTADQAYAAGTIITIQPDQSGSTNPIASAGATQGKGGGLSNGGETVYAFQGTIAGLGNGAAGAITATAILGGIHVGAAAAGDTPTGITLQTFTQADALYSGSTNASDIAAFKALALDNANWATGGTAATLVGTPAHFAFAA
ncbi:MAG: DUF3616 domain-containing protein [Pseudomonadota bacterium]